MKKLLLIFFWLCSFTASADTSSVVVAISLEGYYYDYGTSKPVEKLIFTCSDSGLVLNNRLAFRKISGTLNEYVATRYEMEFFVTIRYFDEKKISCSNGVVKSNFLITIEHRTSGDYTIRKTIYWCRLK